MSGIMHRDPRTMFPDLVEWFEEPFLTLRPYLSQALRIEDYIEDGHYVLRAEFPGIDPKRDLEVVAAPGYVSIRAHRAGTVDNKLHSEFRYGWFNRTVELPKGTDTDGMTASYDAGVLTIRAGMKGTEQEEPRSVPITIE